MATVGFLWLLLVALLTLVASARRMAIDERFRSASAATVIAFLLATVGGVSTLINYWLSPQLRAWNRMSVFIAFFSLVAVALLLDRLRRRLGPAPGPRALFGAALGAVLVVGVLDQTTQKDVPAYKATAAQYHSDGVLVAAIERRLPHDAMVFQLPYQGFPESKPINRMTNYDQVRGYLHSHDLRWSYGAMQGRPADWAEDLADKPASLVVPAVAASGFGGIWVDRFGYSAGGAAISTALRTLSGVAPILSPERAPGVLRPTALRCWAAVAPLHGAAPSAARRDARAGPGRPLGTGLRAAEPGRAGRVSCAGAERAPPGGQPPRSAPGDADRHAAVAGAGAGDDPLPHRGPAAAPGHTTRRGAAPAARAAPRDAARSA